jgi:multiple sugar transport system substrate-binding protein
VLAACAAPAAPAQPAAPAAPAEPAQPAATEAPAPTTAPAAPAGGTIQVLHRQEYFKDLEVELKAKTEEYIKSLGYTPDVSTVNPEVFGDFMAKMQAAVAAGNPPDLTYHGNSIAQMYDLGLTEDHTALVEELVSKYGDIVPATAPRNAKFEDKWWAAPHSSVIGGWYVRKDVAEEAGVDLMNEFSTFQQRLDAAIKMSDPSKEMYGWGLTVNKSGDGHGLIQTAFQAFGGRAVDETGTKITFNSPETVEGVKWLAAIYMDPKYKDILPPGVESWTDPSNNEAYLAGKIAMTQNAPSVYAKAKADKNPVFEKTAWLNFPVTNDGKLILGAGGNHWYTIMKGAKNPDVAKQIVIHFMNPEVFAPLSALGGGLVMPAYKSGWTDELLKVDPNFPMVKDIMFNPNDYTGFAYPAQSNAAIDAWFATGFLSEMMANIITGRMTAEEAVKDATEKGIAIFEEKGLPQS